MVRKYLFVMGIVCVLGILTFAYVYTPKFNTDLLKGDIVFINPVDGEEGLVEYAPSRKYKTLLLTSLLLSQPVFDGKQHFVAVNRETGEIVSYNSRSQQTENISLKMLIGKESGMVNDLQFIPQRDAISFLDNKKLIIFDFDTNETSFLNIAGKYNWSNDGKKIIYSEGGQIFEFYQDTNKKSYLYEGYQPIYSNNNDLIAYTNKNGKLVVVDMKTNKAWKFDGAVDYYKFSPDDNYLALLGSFSANKSRDIIIWNFKQNKKYKLLDKLNIDQFDWK